MSGMGLFLLDVQIEPTGASSIPDITSKIRNGAKLANAAKAHSNLLHLFEVAGENRIVAVVDGAIKEVSAQLRQHCGASLRLTCTPLLRYQEFADKTLQCKKEQVNAKWKPLGTSDHMFWVTFDVDYAGKSMDELIRAWREEAHMAMGVIAGGLDAVLYKVVAQRNVHLFLNIPPGNLDELSFTLPIMKSLGDQVKITCKGILPVA